MNDNKVKYVGTSLKMAETDIDVLEALSKLYDKLYVSYIIAMMNGMMRCGTIMYVNYFWKGSWMKKQLDKQASEPDRESIFKYVNVWTAQYVLGAAYYAFTADYKDANNSTSHWIVFKKNISTSNIELMTWIRHLSERHYAGKLGYSKYRYKLKNMIIPMDRYRQIEQDVISNRRIKIPKVGRYNIDFGYQDLKYVERINSFRLVIRDSNSEYQDPKAKAKRNKKFEAPKRVVYCNFVVNMSDMVNGLYQHETSTENITDIISVEKFKPGRTEFFSLISIPNGRYEQYANSLRKQEDDEES